MIQRRLICAVLLMLGAVGATPAPHGAGTPPAVAGGESLQLPGLGGAPTVPYERLAAAATPQHGLFTIWRYNGSVLLELKKDQFDTDYAELSVPVNGVGGGLFSGITDLAPVRIIRFVRQDNKVAILLPSTRFLAGTGNAAVTNAVAAATAPTVFGVANVVAEDKAGGAVVFDVSSLLQDQTGVADALTDLDGGMRNPMGSYRLDQQKSYFAATKAFPDNVIFNVNQTFSALQPSADIFSVTPDPRNLQITVQYDIAQIPQDDTYMPRLYDDRVGYFVNAHQDFSTDSSYEKERNYIVRFNVQKSDPSQAVSPAKKPVVYYLSNTIPAEYRDPVRKALLTWNDAFAKIGITDAVEVKDQPADSSFDPDDIRYNVVRWVAEIQGGFAEAQLLYNPNTGEMIKSGIVVDSDLMRLGKFDYPILVQPQTGDDATASSRARALFDGAAYAEDERLNYGYGAVATQLESGGSGYPVPKRFADEFLESIVLHESGHDFGLRHNFIGSEAYTAKQLQSLAFTQKHGIASSVMEYAPTNLWPRGTPQGTYFQTVLGPYDYYVIHWGYAPVPGAHTPDEEKPVLRQWAQAWSDPSYAYSSDEDVAWGNGSAIDPRNQQWDLTNDNIAWCQSQMTMAHHLLGVVDQKFPRSQLPYDDLRFAFSTVVRQYGRCAQIVSRYVGGEYVSRSLRGDPHAALPLSAIPIATQKRAFAVIDGSVFSSGAWNLSPTLLRQLVTQYRYDDWLSNMPPRHDVAFATLVGAYQRSVISRFFAPTTLQRLDDIDLKYSPGTTMDLGDLYAWMQHAVYSDVVPGHSIPLIRRNLQREYASTLSVLANRPPPGTPPDAQSLAAYQLSALHDTIATALRGGVPDLMTRAHLQAMQSDVQRAQDAHYVIPVQ
jgi:Met-zincin/Domain of unknown function (DUF5117)